MTEQTVFTETDDEYGSKYIDVWTNTGSDLHILIMDTETNQSQSVYLRDGEALAKAILKRAWF